MDVKKYALVFLMVIYSLSSFAEADYLCRAQATNGGKSIEKITLYFPHSDDEAAHLGAMVNVYWKNGESLTVGKDERLVYRFQDGFFAANAGMYFDIEVDQEVEEGWLLGYMAIKASRMYQVACQKQ